MKISGNKYQTKSCYPQWLTLISIFPSKRLNLSGFFQNIAPRYLFNIFMFWKLKFFNLLSLLSIVIILSLSWRICDGCMVLYIFLNYFSIHWLYVFFCIFPTTSICYCRSYIFHYFIFVWNFFVSCPKYYTNYK